VLAVAASAREPLRTAAELRAQAWLGFGLYAVEQWAPVDLPRVLVTCGQRPCDTRRA
jgi:hypothetical protein